ncbi:MAG TPA: 5-oxoprolinase subunit PxpA [Limnochordales bacterium]
MKRVVLNADMGESFGPWAMGDDASLLEWVTAANVACGLHAGDPVVLLRTVEQAAARGVSVGAHPGYPDRQGFGRREMALSAEELEAFVLYQLGAVQAACRACGVPMTHVKAHGALYHRACRDAGAAQALVQAVLRLDPGLVVVGPEGSQLLAAARQAGLPVAREAFPDRGYGPDGSLWPRGSPGSVVEDPDRAAARAVAMVVQGRVQAVDGSWLAVQAETLCIHGDHPGAARVAARVRRALEEAGVQVVGFTRAEGR